MSSHGRKRASRVPVMTINPIHKGSTSVAP
jgi:hypothetical protein